MLDSEASETTTSNDHDNTKKVAAAAAQEEKEEETPTTTTTSNGEKEKADGEGGEKKTNGVKQDTTIMDDDKDDNGATTTTKHSNGEAVADNDHHTSSQQKKEEVDPMDVDETEDGDKKENGNGEDVEMKDAASTANHSNADSTNASASVKKEEEKKESKDNDDNKKEDDNKSASSEDDGATDDDKDAPQKQEPQVEATAPTPTPAPASAPAPTSVAEAPVKKEEEEKKTDGAGAEKSKSNAAAAPAAAPAAAAAPSPPPPVLKGTLSYNEELRRHLIRGMWNYENSNAFPPQRFELLRTLDASEDPTELPKDGEFHGSFSLAYFHTTSKGKQKERSKVITEHGVQITFTKVEGTEKEYRVDGKGNNQFGVFHINGTATPSTHEGDPSFNIVLRKRYEPSQPVAASADATSKKRKSMTDNNSINNSNGLSQDAGGAPDGPLPPPAKSFESGVVCLRGKLYKEEADDLGQTDVVHRINGMWANGLNLILADPQNVQGHCNRFEYEHKSSQPTKDFPVSGRYSGWFDLTNHDGSKTKITERDVNLRFIKNNAGYHNVEGRGTNAFGKYSITGTLSLDNVITIFRHFKPIKAKSTKVTSAPPPINKGGQTRRPSTQQAFPEPLLKFEDVKVASDDKPGETVEPLTPPDHSAYSAVSRGVLKLGDDGSHTCNGKWAVTREHFTSGQTSLFNFRLEPSYALEAAQELKKKKGEPVEETTTNETHPSANPPIPDEFPLDSAMYRGSFQLKKGGSRYQTIVDQQIVMKFRKNKQGSYNVHGRGQNAIGIFNLVGTLIMRGKSSGQVELYRVYPPEHLTAAPTKAQGAAAVQAPGKVPSFPKPDTSGGEAAAAPLPDNNMSKAQPVPSSSSILPGPPPPRGGLTRRESTRLVKLPSRLEDDDPKAQLSRIMEKCHIILRQLREKDLELGPFFSEPVDPEALGIPTYRQVISEPMDLGTIAKRMDSNQLDSPEEFSRLVRLVFENAMKFNVDPTNVVHLAARSLLVSFNQKYRDIERMVENLRRNHKGTDMDGKKKRKDDKKRKRSDEPKTLKRRRHEEAQAMATANSDAMAAIVAAAPKGVPNAAVSRGEFNMMIHMIQLLQKQIVQTHTALAELSPGDETDTAVAALGAAVSNYDNYVSASAPEPAAAPAPAPERKKPKKKAAEPAPKKAVEEPVVVFDETKPLTLQEQETLTETINNMPADHIPGVIQIIRESASLAGDEDEIDLEIDQLDTVTQRRLLRHVSKYIKQPKKTKGKAAKKTKAAAPAPAPASKQSQKTAEKAPAKKPASPKKSDPGSFFAAFGSKGDSDSDSDDDDDDDEPPKQTASTNPTGGKQLAVTASESKSEGFDLGDGFGGLHDDNDDDLGNGGITANWNLSRAVTKNTEKDKGGDDDDWGAAREHAAAQEAREADRKAREEKLKLEAEATEKQRLAEAAAQSEKLKAQREEEKANEQQKKLEKEKEAKEAQEKARAAMRAQVESVEQTVDLDAQRDIMKQYEQSFLDKELGGQSPSSDFGF